MKLHKLLLIAALLLGSLWAAPSASAEWIWSPQTGWVGPTGAVKDTPDEQLAFASGFFEGKDYKRARIEFKKLLKKYKESREAAEAQYYLGRCAEEQGDYYKAFQDYRKTTQVYPSTQRFDEILQREYQLANFFLAGKKRKVFGRMAILPARDKAVEIFQAIVDDGPFSEYGQLAQYKLGLSHMALGDYEASVGAFEQVISRYPDSPLVDDARFQIAQASLKGTFKSSYDQSPTDLAVRELARFLRDYPTSELSTEAQSRLQELQQRSAQHEYEVARFYERRRHPAAAVIYYDSIVTRFPQSSLAPQAAARIQVLQR